MPMGMRGRQTRAGGPVFGGGGAARPSPGCADTPNDVGANSARVVGAAGWTIDTRSAAAPADAKAQGWSALS